LFKRKITSKRPPSALEEIAMTDQKNQRQQSAGIALRLYVDNQEFRIDGASLFDIFHGNVMERTIATTHQSVTRRRRNPFGQ
jgi:hypothetical protein